MRYRTVIALVVLPLVLVVSPLWAQSRRGELRGVVLPAAGDWPANMTLLQENGFNAVFIKPEGKAGNVLEGIGPAAHQHGLDVYGWHDCWQLGAASQDALAKLEAEGRLQRNAAGQRAKDDPAVGVDWLCPSHPENRKLEQETMLALLRQHELDGLLLASLRLPDDHYCFCDGCKQRFQQRQGVTIQAWPQDVLAGGPLAGKWQQWQAGLMTSLVQEASDAAKALKPFLSIAAATYGETGAAQQKYVQQWEAWARHGTVDFICPAGDAVLGNATRIASRTLSQVAGVHGTVPVYPVLEEADFTSPWELAPRVEAEREWGADGFIIAMSTAKDLPAWLPELRASVTAADPGPMPHRRPPAVITFSGEATAPPAAGPQVIAGARLNAEITLGWDPPAPDPDAETAPDAPNVIFDRMMPGHSPSGQYQEQSPTLTDLPPTVRLSGRIVVERPNGEPVTVAGMFTTEYRFQRTIGFPAPEGAFRLAIYGTVAEPRGTQDYVVRSPVMAGIPTGK